MPAGLTPWRALVRPALPTGAPPVAPRPGRPRPDPAPGR
jgi:hypothetical protein